MQKKGYNFGENKKIRCDLRLRPGDRRQLRTLMELVLALLSPAFIPIPLCLLLSLSHSHSLFQPTVALPTDFATWQWKSALLLYGCPINLSLNYVNDDSDLSLKGKGKDT